MQPQDFWQRIHPPGTFPEIGDYRDAYPARLPDGCQLLLPIRPLADGRHGLASLIINQASFSVLAALAEALAHVLEPYQPEIIAGLPTLGLTLAAAVAERLGHSRYVPLGTSRKFWYDEGLSVPIASITTPGQGKRLYVDPRMLPLIQNRRVVLIDDVISSGASISAGLALLGSCNITPVALGFAMLQTMRWRAPLAELGPEWPDRVIGILTSPMLTRGDDDRWR